MEEILLKYLKGSLTEAEEAQLQEWLQVSDENRRLLERLDNEKWASAQLQRFDHYDTEGNWEKLKSFFPAAGFGAIPISKNRFWRRMAVAASVILILAAGSYFMFFDKGKKGEVVNVEDPVKDVKAPATNRATITLATGQIVHLDSADNGQLAMQGNVKLVKLANGQVAYQTITGEVLTEIKYNTLSNPRGSKVIDMVLADGSHIWLNAGSSVTYPVAFVGNERKLSITGEAYFEVAHDQSKPFLVSKGDMTVQVLGTHFNVNAYDDEANLKVTLLEGSVKVAKGDASEILKPGQQAILQIQGDKNIKVASNIDVEKVMAWKNGYFSFDNSDLQTVMRQLARWYDVDVSYEGDIPEMKFGGDISRNSTASEVLKILEKSKVHFRIEGKRIVVMP